MNAQLMRRLYMAIYRSISAYKQIMLLITFYIHTKVGLLQTYIYFINHYNSTKHPDNIRILHGIFHIARII